MQLTFENLIVALLLIAPGFIAVLIAITLGVVEQNISRYMLFGSTFVSSILIDVGFIYMIQQNGAVITGQQAIRNAFFAPGFQTGRAVLLLALSCALGLLYSIGLILDIQERLRSMLWRFSSRRRNPWQPWEGSLNGAHVVQVVTSDEQVITGYLGEYSRVGKPRQLQILYPQWHYEDKPSGTEMILLFEEDIRRVVVVETEDRFGVFSKGSSMLENAWNKVQTYQADGDPNDAASDD